MINEFRGGCYKMTRSIKQILSNLSENELQEMLKGEYLRRLARYKLADESLREKYGMTFDEEGLYVEIAESSE